MIQLAGLEQRVTRVESASAAAAHDVGYREIQYLVEWVEAMTRARPRRPRVGGAMFDHYRPAVRSYCPWFALPPGSAGRQGKPGTNAGQSRM
jgi:hypothetical protein